MKNFTLSGNQWFDGLDQPALLTQENLLCYFNHAAAALFRELGITLTEGEVLPESLPIDEDDTCETVSIGDRLYFLTVQTLPDGRLYLLRPDSTPSQDQYARLAALLNGKVNNLYLASEHLQNEVGEFFLRNNEKWVGFENQGIYQIIRMGQQADFMGHSQEELLYLYAPEAVELSSFLHELTPSLESICGELGKTFRFQENPMDYPVFVNRSMLRRLLYNLTSNALHAGGNITVTLKKQAGSAYILFSDDGKGIAPNQLSTLFHAYDRPFSLREHGLGLGLTICQRIVRLYGGRLAALPHKKRTVFSLSFPLVSPAQFNEFATNSREHLPILADDMLHQLMIELSVVLPARCYGLDLLD